MSRNNMLLTGDMSSIWLNRVQKLLGNSSMKVLHEAGLLPGMHIADIGCGSGHMTSWLARMVGPAGHVYAIELDKEILDKAQDRIEQEGLANVTFIHANINELESLSYTYDLIYSRLVLMHQEKPEETIGVLKECLNPGGKIVFDECVSGTLMSVPYIGEVIECDRVVCKLLRTLGSTVETGNYLYQYCTNYGFSIELAQFIQPVVSMKEGKALLLYMLREMKHQIISACILSDRDYIELYERVANLPEDKNSCLIIPRMVQLVAVK